MPQKGSDEGRKDTVAWKGNDESSTCEDIGCQKTFSLMNRRHHCRNCGGLFCSGCSNNKIIMPKVGNGRHRACNKCYMKYTANSDIPAEKDTYFALLVSRLVRSHEELVEAGFRVHYIQPFAKRSTQWCVVTHPSRPEACFVSFASSKPVFECLFENQSLDIETINGSRVHSGIYTAVQNEIKVLLSVLLKQIPDRQNVIFSGFSLGGAMATVAMIEVLASGFRRRGTQAITFGAPAVLHSEDEEGGSRVKLPRNVIKPKITNFVCNFDIVPRLLSFTPGNLTSFLHHAKQADPDAAAASSTGFLKLLTNTTPLHTTYTPVGTHVLFQVITDLPSTPYRLSAGVIEPDPKEAPANTLAAELLNYIPFDGVLRGRFFPEFVVKQSIEAHTMEMYFPAIRHLCKTGWGCIPINTSDPTTTVPQSPPRSGGGLYNTSKRVLTVLGANEMEIRPGGNEMLPEGENKIIVEGGSVSSCLVNMENVDELTEVEVGVRLLQNIIDKNEAPQLEVVEGDPSLSPAVIDGGSAYPVAVCLTPSQLLLIPHNPGRPAVVHSVSDIDIISTPMQTDVEWPTGVGFLGWVLIRVCQKYLKVAFRDTDTAVMLYKLLKNKCTGDMDDPEVLTLIEDDGPPSRVSQHSTSTAGDSCEGAVTVANDETGSTWVFQVSPVLGCVLFEQGTDLALLSALYDEEDNTSRAPSYLASDRWLALHMLARKMGRVDDTPVWRVEFSDPVFPPYCEPLGK